ncbi:hypothetical protein HOE67_03450 [Candidatus Peregrinibacteria bacterium]|jgi:hypothetical protein|nr:hypothetical protein [Candidatus Peregrinibacteria bacterium]MBT4056140.1 hypothetical protein [Candidatus Peregrinibacteria bacterium]
MVEIKIIKREGQTSILTRITYILFGVLTATTILALGTRLLGAWGLLLSILLSIGLAYFGLKNTRPRSKLRIVIWSLIGTIITGILIYIGFLVALSNVLGD